MILDMVLFLNVFPCINDMVLSATRWVNKERGGGWEGTKLI